MGSSIGTDTALSTVEAAYWLEGDDRAWMERLLRAALPDLDRGLGAYAATAKIEDGHVLPTSPFAAVQLAPACATRALALHSKLPCPILDAFVARAVVCGGLDEAWPRKLEATQLYRDGMQAAGVVDAFVVFAYDGEGGAVKLVAPSPRPVVTHPRTRAIWGRVALHAASALRLRRRAALTETTAIFDGDGHLLEASRELRRDRSLRLRLTEAVKDTERARGALRHEPERALSVWKALLAGRYSAVDRWEMDGTRYLAVYRNDVRVPDPRALGASEHTIIDLIARGASIKEAAYALGVSVDAATRTLNQAKRKLGLTDRAALAAFVAGTRSTTTLRVGAADVDVLSTRVTGNPEALAMLTAAERAVARAVLRGVTNADIASSRGTSTRTVANQLRNVFAKLGVRSRGELRALLTLGG